MKKILIAAIFVIIITVAIFGTSAYYSDGLHSDGHVLQAGGLDVTVCVTRIDQKTSAVVPGNSVLPAMPGVSCSKIVTVRNDGTAHAYIRVRVQESFRWETEKMDVTGQGLISWTMNDAYWTYRDGYYYYNTALSAGEETQPLFTQVQLSPELDDGFEGSQAFVTISAQAVQVTDNGADVFAADGWPSDREEGGHA